MLEKQAAVSAGRGGSMSAAAPPLVAILGAAPEAEQQGVQGPPPPEPEPWTPWVRGRPRPPGEPLEPLPPYCCAILTEQHGGRIFVEQRGADAAVAAARLTCWGGKREPGESALGCIVRECVEEMSWSPPQQLLRRAVDLYVDGELVAWFFEAAGPLASSAQQQLVFEQGRGGVWTSIDDPRISPWHVAVLRAWTQRKRRADFTSATAEDQQATAELLEKLAAKHAAAAAAVSQGAK